MAKNNLKLESQINITDLIIIIWEGKWKIISTIVISILLVYINTSGQNKNFIAKTNIKPISTLEESRYFSFNKLIEFNLNDKVNYEISKDLLLNLFLETLEKKTLFENAIRKYNLLDENLYANEKEYDEAIANLASSIKINKPKNDDNPAILKYNTINFSYHDLGKWKSVLLDVNKYANETVEQIIKKQYEAIFLFSAEKKKYILEDLSVQIENEIDYFNHDLAKFEQEQIFKIEDIDNKIMNSLSDYSRYTLDRLSFLKEQAAIARELNIAKNTIEAITYNTEYEILANVKTDSPFYLRGYEAIEKEIEIIEKRENINPFVDNLFDLEKTKRELEQDKTIQRREKRLAFLSAKIDLERKKKNIIQDKSLKRAKKNYELIFMTDNVNFLSGSIEISGTKIISKNNNKILLPSAMLIGLIIGLFYVYVSYLFQSRKYPRKR